MASFIHRRGSTKPLVIQPEQPDGSLPDLRDLDLELRFSVAKQCLPVRGTKAADGFEIDLDTIALPAGIYKASVWLIDATGQICAGDIHILFEEGC